MLGCLGEAFLDVVGPWVIGLVCGALSIWVLLTAGRAEHPSVAVSLGLMLALTALFSVVGLAFKRATKLLGLLWVVAAGAFIVFAYLAAA